MPRKYPFAPGRGCAVLAFHVAALCGCDGPPQHRSDRPVLVRDEAGAAAAPRALLAVELLAGAESSHGAGRFAFALPEDLGEFDAVLVRGRARGAHRIELRLLSPEGERRLVRHVDDDSGPEWVLAPRDGALLRATSAELSVAGPDCEVRSLAFVELPVELRMRSPGCERTLLEIDGDARVVMGLPPGRALAADLRPHEAGDTLELSVGRWPARPGEAADASLLLEFETPQGVVPWPFDLGASQRWRSLSCPLTGMLTGARRVRVRSTEDGGAPLALADLWVGQRSATAPSVLLVTCEGDPGWRFEELAERGVRFEDCRAAIPGGVALGASLFTGLSPRDTRVLDDVARLAPDALTLGEAFHAAGFRVFGALGSAQLGPREASLAQGFDRLELAGDADPLRAHVRRLLAWVEEAHGQPLFAWVHLSRAQVEAELAAEGEHREGVLASLLEHPRLRSGVVAVALRRGGEAADLPLPATLQTPLAIAWPDAPAGRRVHAPVELLDLGATLIALGGAPGGGFPGRDLRAELEHEGSGARAHFALGAHGASASVTLEDEVLVLQLGEGASSGALPGRHGSALFDRASDPDGRRDLAPDRRARARALRGLLLEWLAAAGTGGAARAWIDAACPCAACSFWRAPP